MTDDDNAKVTVDKHDDGILRQSIYIKTIPVTVSWYCTYLHALIYTIVFAQYNNNM